MKLEIWSDFACPFCYIGKKRFEEALAAFEHRDQVEVTYKAYQLNPNAPKTMTTSAAEAFAKGHHTTVEKAKERFKMFMDNAKTVGLTYNYDIIQLTNTFDAHRVAKFAKTLDKEVLVTERFMRAYFTEGKNLSDHPTLAKLAFEVGLDQEAVLTVLASDAFYEEVKEEQEEARQIGVTGVPFFVINRTYGISGAQQTDYFLNALRQIYDEENVEVIQPTQTEMCDDGCEF